jgi:hypothetical protein
LVLIGKSLICSEQKKNKYWSRKVMKWFSLFLFFACCGWMKKQSRVAETKEKNAAENKN